MIKQQPAISRKQLAQNLSINESAVQKHIDALKLNEFLIREGGDRGGNWKIIESEI